MIKGICRLAVLPAVLFLGCGTTSTTSAPSTSEPVKFYNAFRTGSETLPTAIEGCESLGSVSASAPQIAGSVPSGFFNPKPLLETLDLRARRKGADTGVVLIDPSILQQDSPTLRATIFRCGDHPVPPEVGTPLE
jgi:hypothetical protein